MNNLISSFQVDHTRIGYGIFVSRRDIVNGAYITTFDIRMKRPNVEPAIHPNAMHTIEHVVATYLRNSHFGEHVVYWGPMGCLTGFYLILKGNRAPKDIYDLILGAFKAVADAEVIPGATAVNCGHYLMHNLGMAKWYAAEFAAYLEANADDRAIFEYPKTERLITDEGQQFFDS